MAEVRRAYNAVGQKPKSKQTTSQVLWPIQDPGTNKPSYVSATTSGPLENSPCVSRRSIETSIRPQRTSEIPVEQFPEEDDDTEYVVEGILAHRERHGETQYLVKWKGYMYEEATWEPEINLGNSMEKLEEYKNRAEKFSRHDTVDTLEKQVQTVKGTP